MIKEDRFLEKIADFCISKSKDLGSTSSNVLVMNTISENVNIRNKKLDGSERSENLGVTLTTYIGKKKASISSTNFLFFPYSLIGLIFSFSLCGPIPE